MQHAITILASCALVSTCVAAPTSSQNITNIAKVYSPTKHSKNVSEENHGLFSIHSSVPKELTSRSLFDFDGRDIVESEIVETISRRKLKTMDSSTYLRHMHATHINPLVKLDFGTQVSRVTNLNFACKTRSHYQQSPSMPFNLFLIQICIAIEKNIILHCVMPRTFYANHPQSPNAGYSLSSRM